MGSRVGLPRPKSHLQHSGNNCWREGRKEERKEGKEGGRIEGRKRGRKVLL